MSEKMQRSWAIKPDTTMFEILYANEEAKKYNNRKLNSFPQKGYDNSECLGDARNVKREDGKVFKGYGFMLHHYLWERIRLVR